jgi:hypothetical protein
MSSENNQNSSTDKATKRKVVHRNLLDLSKENDEAKIINELGAVVSIVTKITFNEKNNLSEAVLTKLKKCLEENEKINVIGMKDIEWIDVNKINQDEGKGYFLDESINNSYHLQEEIKKLLAERNKKQEEKPSNSIQKSPETPKYKTLEEPDNFKAQVITNS